MSDEINFEIMQRAMLLTFILRKVQKCCFAFRANYRPSPVEITRHHKFKSLNISTYHNYDYLGMSISTPPNSGIRRNGNSEELWKEQNVEQETLSWLPSRSADSAHIHSLALLLLSLDSSTYSKWWVLNGFKRAIKPHVLQSVYVLITAQPECFDWCMAKMSDERVIKVLLLHGQEHRIIFRVLQNFYQTEKHIKSYIPRKNNNLRNILTGSGS